MNEQHPWEHRRTMDNTDRQNSPSRKTTSRVVLLLPSAARSVVPSIRGFRSPFWGSREVRSWTATWVGKQIEGLVNTSMTNEMLTTCKRARQYLHRVDNKHWERPKQSTLKAKLGDKRLHGKNVIHSATFNPLQLFQKYDKFECRRTTRLISRHASAYSAVPLTAEWRQKL